MSFSVDYHSILKLNPSEIQNVPTPFRTPALCMYVLDLTKGNLDLIPSELRTPIVCVHALGLNPKCCIYSLDKSLLTREFIITYCVANPEYLRYNDTFNSELENWTYEILCTEVVTINGLLLQYVLQNLQTVEMCRAAIRQTKMALPYVNIFMFDLKDIFAEYTEVRVKEVIREVDEIVNNPKVVYFDMIENRSYIYQNPNPSQSSVEDLIKRSIDRSDRPISTIKASPAKTLELYHREKKIINDGRIFNHYTEVFEDKLVGVIDPSPTVIL
jgi:hypothetical protein